jgi:hypothetical protein
MGVAWGRGYLDTGFKKEKTTAASYLVRNLDFLPISPWYSQTLALKVNILVTESEVVGVLSSLHLLSQELDL